MTDDRLPITDSSVLPECVKAAALTVATGDGISVH